MLAGLAALLWVRCGPLDRELLRRPQTPSVRVTDRYGEVLYEPLRDGGRRERLGAQELPALVVAATVAAEDRRFFAHPGIDPLAVGRAALRNLRAGRVVEGGSTLTQQTAKLLLRSEDRSWKAKLREAVLAMRLEHRLSKREILALYLNTAPYGNQYEGMARASRAYFGCTPRDLTAAQAAYLASLPRRPGAFNPFRDPQRAVSRQRAVLARMALTAAKRREALAEVLQIRRNDRSLLAPHFVERVLSAHPDRLQIRTTLDAGLQREVAGIIRAHRAHLLEHGAGSVAVAVLDNRTGQWLAWEGSGDYFGAQFGGAIDGVISPRQPGSTLKPFTYALAFEQGHTPATILPDIPSHFPTAQEGVVYTPRNYDGKFRGPLRVRAALAGSENVPAVAMLASLGPAALLRTLRNAGFGTLERTGDYYGLGLTLGDAEVRLDQLIVAYATLARGGVRFDGKRLFSERSAFWIADILSDAEAREFAFGSGGSLEFPFRVAVKTGTSQAYRDNWTVGYTRDVTVGVWVGNFDRRELRRSSGVTGAAPIFNAVMLAAVKRVRGTLPIGDQEPIVAAPQDLEPVTICELSGRLPSTHCPATRSEWLPLGARAEFCSWHRQGFVDWPAEYRPYVPARASAAGNAPRMAREDVPLQILNPIEGSTYLIDPTLRSDYQRLRFQARSTSRVSWLVDGRPAGREWSLQRGRHRITAVDASGNRHTIEIQVR